MIFDARLDYASGMIFCDADGQLSDQAPQIDFMDHGFLFGDSLYEVVRLYDGKILGWEPHIKRMLEGAEALQLKLQPLLETMKARAIDCFRSLSQENACCRIVVTRGVGPLHINPQPCSEPRMYFVAWPYDPALFSKPVSLAIPERRRNHIKALSPALKSGNYLNNVMGLDQALRLGADDCLFLNPDEEITELSTSNIVWFSDGEWKTPALSCGILDGITRQYFMRALPVKEVHAKLDELQKADEVGVLSTMKAVLPVEKIRMEDGTEIILKSFIECEKARKRLEKEISDDLEKEERVLVEC